MNILVCLKQILDPEIPPRDFRIDAARREAQRGSAGLVMNIFCTNALETALQFREKHGGKITAISFGDATAEEVLRKALALRVDKAVLITRDDSGRIEPMVAARVLAAAARKLGGFDLILTGREAGDWGDGQTGGLIAEELDCPAISFVEQVAPSASNPRSLEVRRQTDNGIEVIEASSPLVLTITNHEQNVPRIAKTRDIMMAFRQPLTRWSLPELGLDRVSTSELRVEVAALTIPQKETHCEFVAGESLEERVTVFAHRISSVLRSA